MKILIYILTVCLLVVLQPYTLEAQTSLNATLQGEGSVEEKIGVERINVEGTAKGDITGTFLFEEVHEPAFDPGKDVERGIITITDQNGHKLVLKFSGVANMTESEDSSLEGAEGSFTYLEGTGYWAEKQIEGTYSKAGVFQGSSVKLTISLTAEVK